MSQSTFAIFQPGQTLTHDELNLNIEFLDHESSRLGRVVGFGIACGLDGTLDGEQLSISPGRALDQIGRPLEIGVDVLRIDGPVAPEIHRGLGWDFDFSSGEPVLVGGGSALVDTVSDFLKDGADGFTAILRVLETDESAPPCPEDGCEKHATVRCREAEIVFERGRLALRDPHPDREKLRSLGPIEIDPSGKLLGDAKSLREELLRVLGDAGVSDEALTVLAKLEFDGRATMVQAQRGLLLNKVLYLTLYYLRCLDAMARDCIHETSTPGVALGFVEKTGTGWVWSCGFRHDWVMPARQLADSMLTLPCKSPCDRTLFELEREILDFFEIDGGAGPGGGGNGGGGGGVVHCFRCDQAWLYEEMERWIIMARDEPWWGDGVTDPPPHEFYTPPSHSDSIHADGAIGLLAPQAAAQIEAVLEMLGVDDAHVEQVDLSELGDVEGFVAGADFGVGDKPYLVTDADMVVNVGSVPLAVTMGRTAGEIGKLSGTHKQVNELTDQIGEVAGSVATSVESVATLKEELDKAVAAQTDQIGEVAGSVATSVESVATLKEELDKAVAAQTDQIGEVVQQADAVAEESKVLSARLDATEHEARVASDRVHELALSSLARDPERPSKVSGVGADEFLSVVDVMAAAVQSTAATEEQAKAVADALELVSERAAELRKLGQAPEAAPDELGSKMAEVLDALNLGIRAAGAKSKQTKAVDAAIAGLRAALQ